MLTRAFLTTMKGAEAISNVGTRHLLAFVLNPAPGIHSGTYFTDGSTSVRSLSTVKMRLTKREHIN